jgi:hypothetical protein
MVASCADPQSCNPTTVLLALKTGPAWPPVPASFLEDQVQLLVMLIIHSNIEQMVFHPTEKSNVVGQG